MISPKRHHYLPQFYLGRFCRDDKLWVFDRDKKEYRQQTPNNTAVKTHYYSVEEKDGEKRTEIEAMLSYIENHAKQVIDKLHAREVLTDDEKQILSIFLAFMMNRVPDFEKSVNEIEKHTIQIMADMMFSDEKRVQSIMDKRESKTGEKSDISAKELIDFHKRRQYEIVINRNESLRLMLTTSMELSKYFGLMDWGVYHAPQKKSFITTDNPLILVPRIGYKTGFYGVGIITKGARKVFPLSQKACLIMFDRGDLLVHRDADMHLVRKINLSLTSRADRFVIGCDETLVRNLVRTTRLTEWERKGRIIIG